MSIKADSDLSLITAPMAFRVSVRARTAFDETDEDFDIQLSPEGIRLKVRVYLEGALE